MNQFISTVGGHPVEFESLSELEKLRVLTEALEALLSSDPDMPSYDETYKDCDDVLEQSRHYLGKVL